MSSITRITLRLCNVELIKKGRYSSGNCDPDIFSIIVGISANGVTGWGEWLPTSLIYQPGHIGRSGIDEWEVAKETAQRLIGRDVRQLRQWIFEDLRSGDANSLVDGFDFALHDAAARSIGWSVQQLCGGGRPWVWGMPVIHLDEPDATAEHCARHFAEGGYRFYKLKPSCDMERDRETLVKIQERIPVKVAFYIDPNYCLPADADAVVAYLNTLQKEGLTVCEDPVRFDPTLYREIQQRTSVRLMVDEKARTLEQVRKVGETGCARMINIHANWASGFHRGLQRAELAAAYGMETMIGSVRYLGIGTAAYQTLSSLLPTETPCEQVNDAMYVRDSVIRAPYRTAEGRIHIPDTPGLGVEPDPAALERLTIRSFEA